MSKNMIGSALKECRPLFLGALLFSAFINLLMLATPIYSMQVLDRVLSSGSQNTLFMLTIVVVGAVVVASLLQVLRSIVFTNIGRWLADQLSETIVAKSVTLSVHKKSIGNQPLHDFSAVRNFVSSPALGSIFDAPWAIIFFAALYLINVTIGIVVTIGAIILLILAVYSQKITSSRSGLANQANVVALRHFDALTRNAEVLQAMGFLKTASENWRTENKKNVEFSHSSALLNVIVSNSTKTFRMLLQVLLTGLGAYLVIAGQMSAGAIIAVNMLAGKALAPADASVSIYQGLISAKSALGRLQAIFDTKSSATEQAIELPTPKGRVSVVGVSYQEPHSQRWLLRNIQFEAAAASCIGIIGSSGSGKTTLARALVGVLSPTTGHIALDGADLGQWQPNQLGSTIGYLPQDIELFEGTIAQNIARMDQSAEDKNIVQAAQIAKVHEFILTLPDGYQTEIGVAGSNLSAGQRQRIGLARCFYGDVKMVVLDEPNANLDTEGELALLQCFNEAKSLGITILVVAHRPTLLQNADKIVVMNAGQMVAFDDAQIILQRLSPHSNTTPVKPVVVAAGSNK